MQLNRDDVFIAEFHSISEAARQLNLCNSAICNVCKGKLKTHGGYKWKYAENNS